MFPLRPIPDAPHACVRVRDCHFRRGPASARGRRRLCGFLAAVCLAGTLTSALALDPQKKISQYVQTAWNDHDGLPQNSVSSIAQTSDGYLWFGTEEGLARFDGLRFSTFNTLSFKGLRDNYVNALAAAPDGSLWVGTRTGLLQYANGAFQTVRLAQHPIQAIFAAPDGTIWVGGARDLYSVRNGRIRAYTERDGLPDDNIHAIVQGSGGDLWFGSSKGLIRLHDGRFTLYTMRDGLPENEVFQIAPSHDGSLWIGTRAGLARWNGKLLASWPASALPPRARITSLVEDHNGNLWLAFDHFGIATLRNGVLLRYSRSDGLPSNDAVQLFEDHEGHLWVGLSEAGIVELRDGLFNTIGTREGLSEDMIWSVLQARDGSVWTGTNSTGVNHIVAGKPVRDYTLRDGLPAGSTFAIAEDPGSSIWIGSEHGILSHLKNGRITQFHDPASKDARIVAILPLANGDLWVCFHSYNGLALFHDGRFQHFGSPGLLNAAAFAPDGTLWLGSDHGGVTHFAKGVFTSFTAANGLLSNFAQAVYVDKDGVVWAGTSPGGLNRIKNGKITTYSVDQGLFDLTVGAIVEDDNGNLWMTCNRGIFRVSKQELDDYAEGRIHAIHSFAYGTADGLRSAECNFGATPSVWKGRNGELWFATVAGIASIVPGKSQLRPSEPNVLFESVLFNHQPVDYAAGVHAGPGGGDLEIQYAAPEFVSPERIRFRYRLEGFDADWVAVGGRHHAYYTKLPPGHYTFEVQGSNGLGQWLPKVSTLTVVLTPHFWQTNWFRGACLLFLVVLGYLAYRRQTRSLIDRNAELEKRVSRRTQELQKAIAVAEAAQNALKEQATKDGLTGLWNHRTILEILEREMSRAHREGQPICVIMADLDHFKSINDTYGHLAGDRVLQEAASQISSLMRQYDFVGRYGGEEFLIILPGCTLEDGLDRAEQFRLRVANHPMRLEAAQFHVTCSFGVAPHSPVTPSQQLIALADEALYSAKRAGRNRVEGPSNVKAAPAALIG